MKITIFKALIALTLISLSGMSAAQVQYVTDSFKFEIRESPCWSCKITNSLLSGTQVEVLGQQESWSQIVAENGVEGWIFNRYLSELPAARGQLDAAKTAANEWSSKAQLASNQIDLVTRELQQAGIEIELIDITSDDGLASIKAPRIVGNLATLGRQNRELLERSQLLQTELDLRVAEIDRLKQSEVKKFFVYGAGAVIAGALLAVVIPRVRPRRTQSDWA